jgi:hypothetical protein
MKVLLKSRASSGSSILLTTLKLLTLIRPSFNHEPLRESGLAQAVYFARGKLWPSAEYYLLMAVACGV